MSLQVYTPLQNSLIQAAEDLEKLSKRKDVLQFKPENYSYLHDKIRTFVSFVKTSNEQEDEILRLLNASNLNQLAGVPDLHKAGEGCRIAWGSVRNLFDDLNVGKISYLWKWDIVQVNVQDYNRGFRGADAGKAYTVFQQFLIRAFEEAKSLERTFRNALSCKGGYRSDSSDFRKWNGYLDELRNRFAAFETRARRLIPYATPTPEQSLEAFRLMGARTVYAQLCLGESCLSGATNGIVHEYLAKDVEGMDKDLDRALTDSAFGDGQILEALWPKIFPEPSRGDSLRLDALVARLEHDKARALSRCRIEEVTEPDG